MRRARSRTAGPPRRVGVIVRSVAQASPDLTVSWPVDGTVHFPPRCVLCGTGTSRTSELTRKFGRLLVRLRAPICERCEAHRRSLRAGWIAASFAFVLAGVGGVLQLQRAGFADAHAELMFLFVSLFIGAFFAWFVVLEEHVFLRWHTRLWIEQIGPRAKTLMLASRDAALIEELRAIVAKAGG